MNVYKVRKGDTLDSIALSYKLTAMELARANRLNYVMPGMRLLIPNRKGIPYTVQPYDTLEKIAKRFSIDIKTLIELNNTERVFLGQLIYIPEKNS